ncbi:MAG: UDP-2,3-diacylglucosamine diphosphatase LpxI [Phycisphaerae bacterium]
MPSTNSDVVGLIAGAGRFPFMVADGARRAGCRVVIVALRGLADPELASHADSFHWAGLARMGRWIRIFSRAGVKRAVMAGYVHKQVMYGRFRLLKLLPDWTGFKLWFFHLRDKRNDTVLSAVADVLQSRGVTLENATRYCPESLASQGLLSGPPLTPDQQKDVDFGWCMAKEIGRLDIGQAVAVKETEVIAVEAIEGTDRMIERAGSLCKHGGWCLVKVAKPDQDMRFDVPTVGPETMDRLHGHGAKVLVIEADKTVIVEKEKTLAAAAKHGITIIARL